MGKLTIHRYPHPKILAYCIPPWQERAMLARMLLPFVDSFLEMGKEVSPMLQNTIRGYLGVVLGCSLTFMVAVGVLLTAPIYQILFDWWICRWTKNPFTLAPKLWAALLDTIVFRWLVAVRVALEGSIEPLREGEIVLWIGNHPSTMATASVARAILALTPRAVFVAKHDLNPFMKWPVKAISNGAIFINREDPESWRNVLKHEPGNTTVDRRGLVLFPDTHRATPKRIARELEKFSDTIPGLGEWLTHTLIPRSGGLFTVLQGLEGRALRILNLTGGYSVAEWGVRDAPDICDATLRIRIEDVTTEIPRNDEDKLRTWLLEEWKKKNQLLHQWQNAPTARPGVTSFDQCTCPKQVSRQ